MTLPQIILTADQSQVAENPSEALESLMFYINKLSEAGREIALEYIKYIKSNL
jgi:hypothetical protein